MLIHLSSDIFKETCLDYGNPNNDIIPPVQNNRKKSLLVIIAVVVLLAVVLSLPPVWSRVVYHSRAAYTSIKYWLKPPSEAVFVPSTGQVSATATQAADPNTVTAATAQPTTESIALATQTPAPVVTPIPLPSSVLIKGFTCEVQTMNNCGPATLSIYLSHYDWGKSQTAAAAVLKPNERDVNVSPYEIVDFVNHNTEERALWRYGGDAQTIKTLLNAGYPVMIEKSFQPYDIKDEGWMGHYNLVVGYDDQTEIFTVHDTYLLLHAPWGGNVDPSLFKTFIGFDYYYSQLEQDWRSFNDVFIVVYPPEKENDVLQLLGPLTTEEGACQAAYDQAKNEATTLTDVRDRFFAWFNAGTSLVCLKEYDQAAAAFDAAYSIYPDIPLDKRPYRMLWYETGPYSAYYYVGRYQDVINLANQVLSGMGDPVLEESYYWRGVAFNALGDTGKAVSDLKSSLKYHPGYGPSLEMLKQLGVAP